MKEKIIKIMLGWIENNEPIETTADKLLDLFAVSGRSEQLLAFAEFIDKDLIDNVPPKEIVERFLSQ